jgi:quercetin dioxygenase-like cupin family protein
MDGQPSTSQPSTGQQDNDQQDNGQRAGRVLVRQPGEGPATWAMGSLFERVVSGGETGGAFCMSLVTQPPGTATPLHVHTREAEAFYVLDGTLIYQAGEELHHLTAGSFIYLPTAVPHAFRVTGSTPVRFLGLASPGGLMDLYDEVGIPARERRLPGPDGTPLGEDVVRWLDVAPRYGLQVVGPPIPPQS